MALDQQQLCTRSLDVSLASALALYSVMCIHLAYGSIRLLRMCVLYTGSAVQCELRALPTMKHRLGTGSLIVSAIC